MQESQVKKTRGHFFLNVFFGEEDPHFERKAFEITSTVPLRIK